MDKYKAKMNEIRMNDDDKQRVLNNILKYQQTKQTQKQNLSIKNLFIKLIIFITSFAVLGSTAYATVKIFKIDEKLSNLFDKSSEQLETYGVGSTEILKTIEMEDGTITANQTIVDEREIYISLDIYGTKAPIYITDVKFSDKEGIFATMGFGSAMLEEDGNHTGYIVSSDINGEIKENTEVTITLFMNNGRTQDITFKVSKNDMKVKETKTNTVIYNEDGITATVTSIRLSPLNIMVDLKYNVDLKTLDEATLTKLGDVIYNDNNNNKKTFITYKDGTTYQLRFWYNSLETMLKPYRGYRKQEMAVDVETIKSVTINGVEIKIGETQVAEQNNKQELQTLGNIEHKDAAYFDEYLKYFLPEKSWGNFLIETKNPITSSDITSYLFFYYMTKVNTGELKANPKINEDDYNTYYNVSKDELDKVVHKYFGNIDYEIREGGRSGIRKISDNEYQVYWFPTSPGAQLPEVKNADVEYNNNKVTVTYDVIDPYNGNIGKLIFDLSYVDGNYIVNSILRDKSYQIETYDKEEVYEKLINKITTPLQEFIGNPEYDLYDLKFEIAWRDIPDHMFTVNYIDEIKKEEGTKSTIEIESFKEYYRQLFNEEFDARNISKLYYVTISEDTITYFNNDLTNYVCDLEVSGFDYNIKEDTWNLTLDIVPYTKDSLNSKKLSIVYKGYGCYDMDTIIDIKKY